MFYYCSVVTYHYQISEWRISKKRGVKLAQKKWNYSKSMCQD